MDRQSTLEGARVGRWGLLTVGGLLVLAGVAGTLFFRLGLDKADQLASVISMFLALAGLGVSVVGLRHPVATRGGGAPSNPPPGDVYNVTNIRPGRVSIGPNQRHYSRTTMIGSWRPWRRGR